MVATSAKELFQSGRLREATELVAAEVKARPGEVAPRAFYAELLCFGGELDRADKQLDTLSQLQPTVAVGVALFRQLLRAAKRRRQWFDEGRLPDFFMEPSASLKQHLEAIVVHRAGDTAAAQHHFLGAEAARCHSQGMCDGQPFDDLRDLDDVAAPILETLGGNGAYSWVEWNQVVSLEFGPIEHPRDLLWRPARLSTRTVPEMNVYLPTLYPRSEESADDATRLGRTTTWQQEDSGPARGLGQRVLLVGDSDRPFLELRQITVTA